MRNNVKTEGPGSRTFVVEALATGAAFLAATTGGAETGPIAESYAERIRGLADGLKIVVGVPSGADTGRANRGLLPRPVFW